ncbi:BLOC-1-related complex subunit 6 [Scaptodrosophila lebanonensis]|uniref:BLOC-1-related complex subunit 6 n=1 Tax=Drosophila lebanonensis TaxID=7225 RepID=A0A6J2TVL9_DROLE|nr:BLOC-1-related complex subunit 6 [Scaptodrosophila lebanonensis]
MSRRSQDIPIRPRYGYTDEDVANESNRAAASTRNNSTPASSYTEIPFLAQYAGPIPERKEETQPSSNESYVNLDMGDEEEEEEDNTNSKDSSEEQEKTAGRPTSLNCEPTFPYELEGSTSKTGEMRHFVAHNLEATLREGSPQRPTDYSNASEQTTPSTSTAPGVMTRRFLQSRNIPEIDGNVLSDIELEAQYLATAVDNLLENLGNLLHSISSITADNVEVHKNAVSKLTDTLDANIKCMYTIMAKTEEISKSMRPTEQLGQRIREIKRLVDMLDNTM